MSWSYLVLEAVESDSTSQPKISLHLEELHGYTNNSPRKDYYVVEVLGRSGKLGNWASAERVSSRLQRSLIPVSAESTRKLLRRGYSFVKNPFP
jgi:hypothetical protein